MSGELADGAAARAIDASTGRTTITPLSTFVALLTAAPNPTDLMEDLAEVAPPGTLGYARQQAVWSAPTGSPPTTHNVDEISFGPFSDDLAPVTHCALVTTQVANAGLLLFYWVLDDARDPAIGDTITFSSGSLTIHR